MRNLTRDHTNWRISKFNKKNFPNIPKNLKKKKIKQIIIFHKFRESHRRNFPQIVREDKNSKPPPALNYIIFNPELQKKSLQIEDKKEIFLEKKKKKKPLDAGTKNTRGTPSHRWWQHAPVRGYLVVTEWPWQI